MWSTGRIFPHDNDLFLNFGDLNLFRISIFGFRILYNPLVVKSINRGFTLLELLVVLVIIALASGLVVPRLIGSLSNTALLTAGKQITASLRWARSTAVSQRLQIASVFDIPNNRLVFISNNANGDESGQKELNMSGVVSRPPQSYDLPRNVSFETGITTGGKMVKEEFQILFYPAGNSSGGEIVLNNERGRRLKIVVDFITGTARLLEMTSP